MRIEYKLDQWEWQGTTRAIEVNPDDYRNMSGEAIKQAVYGEIRRDAEQNLHLVYEEDAVVGEILAALESGEESDDDED